MKFNSSEYCENWLNRLNLRLKRIEIEKEILEREKMLIFVERETVEQLRDELRKMKVSNE